MCYVFSSKEGKVLAAKIGFIFSPTYQGRHRGIILLPRNFDGMSRHVLLLTQALHTKALLLAFHSTYKWFIKDRSLA